MSSFVDPAFKSKKYTRIMVYVKEGNLQSRKEMEDNIVGRARSYRSLALVSSLNLFPPTRAEYTVAERDSVLKGSNVDAVLTVVFSNAGTATNYQSATSYSYADVYSTPWATTHFELTDVATMQKAWIADATSSGGKWSTFSTIFSSIASRILRQLEADHLIGD